MPPTPPALAVAAIFFLFLIVFGRIVYLRGKEVSAIRYNEMFAQRNAAAILAENRNATLTDKLSLMERMRDEQKEKWRIANNRLQTIWAVTSRETVRVLLGTIEEQCKEHHRFIPDPVPNGKRGAHFTQIQNDGTIGVGSQKFS